MAFSDIQIVVVDPNTHVVTFKIRPILITKISKLIQIVVLSLLGIAGRDVLDPDKGGGLPSMVGQNFDPGDMNEVFAEVAQRVRKTEQEVLQAQVGLQEDPEAKLRLIQIMSLQQGQSIDELAVKLRIINEAGRTADIVL